MIPAEQQASSRQELFKQIILPLQDDPSSSGECARLTQEFEDFERRFNLIESHYTKAYEHVQKLEICMKRNRSE